MLTLSALGYLIYNYAIFGFAVAINPMTPIHIAVLGLATWSLVLNLMGLAANPLQSAVGGDLPRRAGAAFLILVAALFGLMWLGQIAQTIQSGVASPELVKLGLPTNPVYTLDLAFALPFLVVSGWLLLRDAQIGREVAVAALAWVVLMGFGILAIFALDAAAGAEVALPVVVLVGAVTAVGIVLTALGLRPARRRAAMATPMAASTSANRRPSGSARA